MKPIRFSPLVAKLLLGIPVVAMCFDTNRPTYRIVNEQLEFRLPGDPPLPQGQMETHTTTIVIWSLLIWGILWVWLHFQDKRRMLENQYATLPSSQVVRAAMWVSIMVAPVFWTMPDGMPWAKVLYTGLFVSLGTMVFAYRLWGWTGQDNGLWATLPWPWNPDSDEIRNWRPYRDVASTGNLGETQLGWNTYPDTNLPPTPMPPTPGIDSTGNTIPRWRDVGPIDPSKPF